MTGVQTCALPISKESDKTKKIELKELSPTPKIKPVVKKEESKQRRYSPMIYALSGAIIVLLIFLGYLLINRNTTPEKVEQTQPQITNNIETEKPPEQITHTQTEPTQEQKIALLLTKAKKYIAENKLTTPAGNNANETINEILSIDPYNKIGRAHV